MEYTLFFPTPWDAVNPENDNIDVCLTFSDGRSFTFVVATPENLKFLMKQEGKPYLSPGAPMLIAEKLTPEAVTGAGTGRRSACALRQRHIIYREESS